MIRFLFRLLGFLILAAGFVALVIDGTRAVAGGALKFTPAETSWTAVAPDSLDKAKALVDGTVPAASSAFATVLAQPTFAVLGVIGVVLMLIGRRRRRSVGVEP